MVADSSKKLTETERVNMSGDTSTETKQPLFRDIAADDDDPEITEMESLCVNCEAQVI